MPLATGSSSSSFTTVAARRTANTDGADGSNAELHAAADKMYLKPELFEDERDEVL